MGEDRFIGLVAIDRPAGAASWIASLTDDPFVVLKLYRGIPLLIKSHQGDDIARQDRGAIYYGNPEQTEEWLKTSKEWILQNAVRHGDRVYADDENEKTCLLIRV